MAAGENVIVREATGTTADNGAALTAFSFDTEVRRDSSIFTLVGTPTTAIDVGETGHYLCVYNLGYTSSGTNRSEMLSQVRVNGTPTAPYGYATGYIRRSGSDNESSQCAATILDLTAGDDVSIYRGRTDSNTLNGVCTQTADESGFQLVRLDDSWNYFRARDTTTQTLTHASGETPPVTSASFEWQDVLLRTEDEKDTGFTHSTSSSQAEITLVERLKFLICYQVKFNNTSGSVRVNGMARLVWDGAVVQGSHSTAYARGSNGCQYPVASGCALISASSASKVLKIQAACDQEGTGTLDIASVAITIVEMPATVGACQFRQTADHDHNSATFDAIDFNAGAFSPDAAFSHDSVTDPHKIEMATSGQYLFCVGFLHVRTGLNTSRKRPRASFLMGTTDPKYGICDAFNRGDQSNTSSWTAGGAAIGVFDFDSADLFIQAGGSDPTLTTDSSTAWAANETAIFGLDLSSFVAPGPMSATIAGTSTTFAELSFTVEFSGTGAGVMPPVVGDSSSTAELIFLGSGAAFIAQRFGSGMGINSQQIIFSGTGAGTISPTTGTGAGLLEFIGTGAAMIPAATGAGAGATLDETTGTGSGLMAPATGTANGLLEFSGTSAGVMAPALGTGAGTSVDGTTGTGAGVAAASVGTGLGELRFRSAGSGAVPARIGTGTGTSADETTGTGAGTMPPATGSGLALLEFIGTSAAMSPAMTGSGVGALEVTGVGAGSLAPATGVGTGALSFVGTGSSVLAVATSIAAGELIFLATGGGALAPIVGTGSGTSNDEVAGSGSAVMPPTIGTGEAELAFVNSRPMKLELPPITGSGAGTSNDEIDGSGAAVAAPIVGTGEGLLEFTGAGAAVVAPVVGTSEGLETFLATGEGALAPVVGIGTGSTDEEIAGSGASITAPIVGTGNSIVEFVGSGSGSIGAVLGAGEGVVVFLATGSGELAPITGTGVGGTGIDGIGAGTMAPAIGDGNALLIFEGAGATLLAPLLALGGGVVGEELGCATALLGDSAMTTALLGDHLSATGLDADYLSSTALSGDRTSLTAILGDHDTATNLDGSIC